MIYVHTLSTRWGFLVRKALNSVWYNISGLTGFECRGKAFQAIVYLLSLPRATLRLPPVTYICKQMCIAFQASLSNPIYVTSLSSLYM